MNSQYILFKSLPLSCLCFFIATAARSQVAESWETAPQQRSAGNGFRMVASSTYSYSGNRLAPIDSTEFYFPSHTTDIYDSYETFSASGSGTWKPHSKFVYAFDEQGYLKQTDIETWNTTTWAYVASTRWLDSLNSDGQLVHQLAQRWDSVNNTYVDVQQNFFVRNTADLVVEQRSQKWDSATSNWVNDWHVFNEYNQQGYRISIVNQRWKVAANAWGNADSFSNVYDGSGLINTQNFVFIWDAATGAWKATSRQTVRQSPADSWRLTISESPDGSGGWIPVSIDSTTYTAANEPDVSTVKVWDAGTNAYVNQSRTTHTYDAADLLTLSISERWASGAWSMAADGAYQTHKYYESYSPPTDLASHHAAGPKLSLSPNPANQILHFSFNSEAPASFTASMIDVRGRVFHNFSAQHVKHFNKNLSTAALPTGNYFVRVTPAGGQPMSQMIRVKH